MLSKDYILGFVEGEGCFSVALSKNIDRKPRIGKWKCDKKNPYLFAVKPSFRVTNCEANKQVLEEIKEVLGFGSIYIQKRGNDRIQNAAQFYTKSFSECLKAREFFKTLTFNTTKGEDFKLWCKCLEIMEQSKHLEKEGLLEICRIRDQMNFRKTKCKWTTEEVERILNEKPLHFTAHFDENQQDLLHNQSGDKFDLNEWLAARQGNRKQNQFVNR
ncbi:MAG: LAGLIDADG family homing endonuclease [archaeon]|jgi:hypothetical protein